MAVVNLTSQLLSRAATTPSYTGSLLTSNQYFVSNDGRLLLHFKKVGANPCVVTVVTPGNVDAVAIADLTFTVPATTGDVMVGGFRPEVYNDPTTGLLQFTLSEITGLSVACIQMPS